MTTLENYTVLGSPIFGSPKKFIDLMYNQSGAHIHALDESSYLWAWGNQNPVLMGNYGAAFGGYSPVSVMGGRKWLKVVVYDNSTCALDSSSFAWCWGWNGAGQLGDGTTLDRSSPVSVLGGRTFIDIGGGYQGFFALDSSSFLWSWGANNGDGTTSLRSSPVSVLGNKTWRKFPREFGGVFLDSSSYAWSWGSNTSGVLGDGTLSNRSSPVSVLGGKQWKTLGINSNVDKIHAIDSSDYLWGWGMGKRWIGDNTNTDRSSPVSVLCAQKFLQVEFFNGGPYTVGMDFSSRIWHWGATVSGTFSVPVLLTNGPLYLNPIVTGPGYAYGINESSFIVCWGLNFSQLGENPYTGTNISVPYQPLSVQFKKVTCTFYNSYYSTVALDVSSNLWTWGGASPFIGDPYKSGVAKSNPSIMAGTRSRSFMY